ncbi:MAG: alpha-amylase family glycosyl hydrolase [Rhizobiaceae bacterium]
MSPKSGDWWKKGVVYQIYPRSFMDSSGDGVGDLAGIESRLDHVVQLGADAIWISPFYPSPMADFGYDVSDYCDVDPLFGDLAAFDRMLETAHARGLKVLLDMVPSHTSEQHPWFVESRQSRNNPKRDWYVWSDPAPGGGPPNNWISEFGGPAWTLDEASGQYYLHIFLAQQPSLNWRNRHVRDAVFGAMRFWFDRGVDGFRVDAIENLVPDAELRDNPRNPDWVEAMGPARSLLGVHTQHRPEVFEYVAEMRRVARSYDPERLLIGEAYGTLEQIIAYYGKQADCFHLPFNFQLIGAEWSPGNIARIVDAYEAALPPGAWPNWVLSNHDRSRFASRVGQAQARVAAMMLLTLRGTPTIYQGEELGMENMPIPPERVMDPWEKNVPGIGLGRDPVRTPLAWTQGPGAGFTTGEPWLPIDERAQMCVDVQSRDEGSMLSLYRRLLDLRRREDALSLGDYRTLHVDESVFCYERSHGGRRFAIALNFSQRKRSLPVAGKPLLSTLDEKTGLSAANLAPDEGRILELG